MPTAPSNNRNTTSYKKSLIDLAPLTSAFGDTLVAEVNPEITLKATYGVLDECATFTATGGSATASNSEFLCQTGTSAGGYGVLWSRLPLVYHPGLGAEARLTARFTTPVALSLQACGFFTAADGMFFGYNGTSFGIMHRHGGNFEARTLTVTQASGSSATVTVTLNSVQYTAAVTNTTAQANAHEIADALSAGAAATLWYIQHIDNTVVFLYKGAAEVSGTYSVSVSGGTFTGSIAQNAVGVAPTETWTAQADWNNDTCSWLDPTKGNLYKLQYAYLGYGPLSYYVFNPYTATWVLAHTVDWPNENTGVNLSNPSLRVGWVSASLGSSGTNLTVAGGSAMAAHQGDAKRSRPFGAFGNATGVTTETQVLSIRSRRLFGGRSNNGLINLKGLSLSTDSTKGAVFRVLINPTVSGTDIHQYVDSTQSIALYDTAGTTVTGGRLLGVYSVGPSGRIYVDISSLEDKLVAGDELVITAQVTSGAAADMTVSVVWSEEV